MLEEQIIYQSILQQLEDDVKKDYQQLSDICKRQHKQIVIFGAGTYGKYLLEQIKQYGLVQYLLGFSDNDKNKLGGVLENVPIYSLDYYIASKENLIFLIGCQNSWYEEILQQLQNVKQDVFKFSREQKLLALTAVRKDLIIKECPCGSVPYYLSYGKTLYETEEGKEKLDKVYTMLEDDISKRLYDLRISFVRDCNMKALFQMYDLSARYGFDKDLLEFTEQEVFVDCGAFIGDSIQNFLHKTGGHYKKIYAFEPDFDNYNKLLDYLERENISAITYMAGVGEKNENLSFDNSGHGGALFTEAGADIVPIMSLNETFKSNSVTYIKMDIEGFEMKALQGAKDIIVRDKPKLHISIYHKPEDLYEIPLYLSELVPEYHYKLCHHTEAPWDTDLYAWTE